MKIYVGHSSSIDFRENLYKPLKDSKLSNRHDLVFPHEESKGLFDSKSFLRDEADLMIAEVSNPSTGLGIELGWADSFDVPIISFHKEDANPSESIKAVKSNMLSYNGNKEMIKLLKRSIDNL